MEFAINQEVTVFGGSLAREPLRVVKIANIGKRKIKCDDGSEWNVNGDAWGSGNDPSWFKSHIRPATGGDKDDIVRRVITGKLSRFPWHTVSLDVLREIYQTVKRHEKPKSE